MSTGIIQGNAASITMIDVTWSPAQVAANTSAAQTVTVNGVRAGDSVLVAKPTAQAGLITGHARVSANDTVSVTFGNFTASPITPTASEVYRFTVIRPEGGSGGTTVLT